MHQTRNIRGMRNIDPIERFNIAMARAEASGIKLPNAMTLATAGADGKPSSRMMLLKGADARGFVFYTNLKSRKGGELEKNPNVSLCFWWPALEEQVRIEGKIKKVSDREADEYFATRPRGSQIGAWASEQSRTLESREELLKRAAELEKKYHGKPVPRPPYWSGFITEPAQIEFWFGKPDRLHERYLYTRQGKGWNLEQLYP